jgi:hypothetical protein
MNKKILSLIISDCRECPFYRFDPESHHAACSNEGFKGIHPANQKPPLARIVNGIEVPDQCPLLAYPPVDFTPIDGDANPHFTKTCTVIVAAVSAHYKIASSRILRSRARDRPTVVARHAAIYLIKKSTGEHDMVVSKVFGRDRSLIPYVMRVVQFEYDNREDVKDSLNKIKATLGLK